MAGRDVHDVWPDGSALFAVAHDERASSPSTVAVEPAPVSVSETCNHTPDLRRLFDTELLSDVVLEVRGADGSARLHAHKLVLVASSVQSVFIILIMSNILRSSSASPQHSRTQLPFL